MSFAKTISWAVLAVQVYVQSHGSNPVEINFINLNTQIDCQKHGCKDKALIHITSKISIIIQVLLSSMHISPFSI